MTSMRVLVTATEEWALRLLEDALREHGHEPVRGTASSTCTAASGSGCPAHTPIDVACTWRTQASTDPARPELSLVCALCNDAPLVVTGWAAPNPFDSWASHVVHAATASATVLERVVRACEGAAAARSSGGETVRRPTYWDPAGVIELAMREVREHGAPNEIRLLLRIGPHADALAKAHRLCEEFVAASEEAQELKRASDLVSRALARLGR